jgi:hypothetical protein
VIHGFYGAAVAVRVDVPQAATEHTDAVAQKRADGGIVMAFGHTLLASQAHHALVDLSVMQGRSKGSAEEC